MIFNVQHFFLTENLMLCIYGVMNIHVCEFIFYLPDQKCMEYNPILPTILPLVLTSVHSPEEQGGKFSSLCVLWY